MLEIFKILKELRHHSQQRSMTDACQLEDRVLLSATPMADGGAEVAEVEQSTTVEHVMFDSSSATENPDEFRFNDSSATPQSVSNETTRFELVFVDTGAENYEQLVADLMNEADADRDFEVFLLEADRDGVEQISEVMAAYDSVDAVHLVSHGVAGSVKLGNTWLSVDNLNAYAGDIAGWNNALASGGDLLIYGCDLASSEDGRSLAESLGALCDRDVAASDDDTGSANRGGDFDLEYATGAIETNIAFSSQLQQEWQGLLAYQTYRDEFNAVNYTNSDGTQDWTGDAWQEPDDSGQPSSGQVRVETVLGEQGLNIRAGDQIAVRGVDLSSASSAFLTFKYARVGLDNAGDYIALEISNNGGGAWTEVDRFTGNANDAELLFASYDISEYASADTQIRFVTSGSLLGSESLFIDDLQIAFSTEGLADTTQILVNTNQTGAQQISNDGRGSANAVAVAANGDYVVVWTDENGANSGVYGQRYDATGVTKGGGFIINTTTSNDQKWASVATDADGSFAVTWTSQNQDGDGQGVYVRLFNSNGVAQTGEILVNTTTTGDQHASSIAMSAEGDFVVVWQGEGTGDNRGIFAQRFNAAGVAQGGETRINNNTGGTQDAPSVDMNSSSQYVITWDDNDGFHARQYNADGTAVGAQFTIDGGGSAGDGDIAIDENGGFVAVWRETQGGNREVLAQRYSADGATIGGQISVNSTNSNDQTNPSVDSDGQGNFVVVWEGNGAGDNDGVFYQQFDSSGSKVGNETLVNNANGDNQQMASIAMLNLHEFVVVWTGSDANSDGVFARQFANTVANDPPSNISIASNMVNENTDTTGGALAGTLSATDPDSGETFTFSVIPGGDAEHFSIVGDKLRVDDGVLDFETQSTYSVTVRVSDSADNTYDETLQFFVNDLNEEPTITSANAFNVDENETAVATLTASDFDAGDSVTWSITGGDDAGAFSIDIATGELTFNTAPDFEAPTDNGANNTYQVEVTATDSGTATDVQLITVTVGPLNDNNPNFTSANTATVDEGSTTVITVNATDADSPMQTVTYSVVGGVDGSKFVIDANTGELGFVVAPDFQSPTDANGDNVYEVTIAASDGANTTNQSIGVTVANTNDAPTITSPPDTNTPENTINVTTISASDVDGDTLEFSIVGGADADQFTIDRNTGLLRFLTPPNWENTTAASGNSTYEVTVRASDGKGAFDQQAIRISVTNVNDAPQISTPTYTVSNNRTLAVAAPGYLAGVSDEDGDALVVSLVQGTENGTLTFNADGSFEYVADENFSGEDSFTIRVSDGAGGESTATIQLRVNASAGAVIQAPETSTTVEEETTTKEESSTEEETSSEEEITAAAVANVLAPQTESAGNSQQIGGVVNIPATVISDTQIALNLGSNEKGETSSYLPLETVVQTKRNMRNRATGATTHVASTYSVPFDTTLLWEDLGEMEQELQTNADTPYFVAGSAAAFTSSLTVGYVLWTIRSGWLVTSMLAQLPAWRIVDPLVVLDYLDDPAASGDEESLESMLEKEDSDKHEAQASQSDE